MADEITIPGKDGKPDQVITKGAFLSSKLFQLATTGDLAAIKMCLDNIDGPPTQGVELTGKDGGPLELMQQIGGRFHPKDGNATPSE